MPLTHDDVKKLVEIIDAAEHLEEMELAWGDFQIHLWRGAQGSSAAPGAPVRMPGPSVTPASADRTGSSPPAARPGDRAKRDLVLGAGEVAIRSPMIGTFYRAASPGEPAFVEVGQTVRAGDTVCLIEVMKLFNSIHAGVDGTVTRILHENATLVEFDEPLIVIQSATDGGK
jgi:acetyl-CoA carboxylase biotin carboxyl carrier protein